MEHQTGILSPFGDISSAVKREPDDVELPVSIIVTAPNSQADDLEPGEVVDDNKPPLPASEQERTGYNLGSSPESIQLPDDKNEPFGQVMEWSTLSIPQQHVYTPFSQPVNPFLQHQVPQSTDSHGNHHAQTIGSPECSARNRARLQEIVTRLQNVHGSVDDLLEIASLQQQIDRALEDLTRAQNLLKSVLGQFQREGSFTDKQVRRRDSATKEMNRKCQQVSSLVNELSRCRRRQIQSHAAKGNKKGSS